MGQTSLPASQTDSMQKETSLFYEVMSRYSQFGRKHLIEKLLAPRGGTVLELGCGTGRNLIAAARAYPSSQVFGVDSSEARLRVARSEIGKAGLRHRIHIAQADIVNFDPFATFGHESFDRVILSYCLSRTVDWERVLQHGMMLRSAGGVMVVMEFGQQERLPHFLRRILNLGLQKSHMDVRANLKGVLNALVKDNRSKLRFERLYRGYVYYAELDASFYSRFMETQNHLQLNAVTEKDLSPIRKAS